MNHIVFLFAFILAAVTNAETLSTFLANDLISGRRHNCALSIKGAMKCWGNNDFGQRLSGNTTAAGSTQASMGEALSFLAFPKNFKIKKIEAGSSHNCALSETGDVICWGNSESGELGLGSTNNIGDTAGELGEALVKTDFGMPVTNIFAGYYNNCAILSDETVRCWGNNSAGQLGLGDVNNRGDTAGETPKSLPALNLGDVFKTVKISFGNNHACALSSDKKVKCWGENNFGQLGLGDTQRRGDQANEMGNNLAYVDLGNAFEAADIYARGNYSCAISTSGFVKCWGRNETGLLGLGDTAIRGDQAGEMGDKLPVVNLGENFKVVQLSGGDDFLCGLSEKGAVKCWGANPQGQLGLGDTVTRGDQPNEMGKNLPTLQLDPVVKISAARFYTCVLFYNRNVSCWGLNDEGQLGVGHQNNLGDQTIEIGANLPYIYLGMD